jgi:hypothetical protein
MPQVEVCYICDKELDPDREKFVLVAEKSPKNPRVIAHLECHQGQRGKTGSGPIPPDEW